MIKKLVALILVLLLSLESFAAVVSDNDGAAFITKAEFDSLKNNFQSQIDQYNTSIDSKIDGAIASYLAGIQTSTYQTIPVATNGWENICFQDGLFANVVYKKATKGTLNIGEIHTDAVPTRLRWNKIRLYRDDVPWCLTRMVWEHWSGLMVVVLGVPHATSQFRPVGYNYAFVAYNQRLMTPFLNVKYDTTSGLFIYDNNAPIFLEEKSSNLWFYDHARWENGKSISTPEWSMWNNELGRIGDVHDIEVYNNQNDGRVYDISFEYNLYRSEDPTSSALNPNYLNVRMWGYSETMKSTYHQQQVHNESGSDGLYTNIAKSSEPLRSEVYDPVGIDEDAMTFAWETRAERNRQLMVWRFLALGEDDDNYPELSGIQPTKINLGHHEENGANGSINDWSFGDSISTNVDLTSVELTNIATNANKSGYWDDKNYGRTDRSFLRTVTGKSLTFNVPTYKSATLDQLSTGISNADGLLNMKQGMQLWGNLEREGKVIVEIKYEKLNSASGTVSNPNLVKFSLKGTDFANSSSDYYMGQVNGSSTIINLKNVEYNDSKHIIKIEIDAKKGSDGWLRISPVNNIDDTDTSKRNLDYVKFVDINQSLVIE